MSVLDIREVPKRSSRPADPNRLFTIGHLPEINRSPKRSHVSTHTSIHVPGKMLRDGARVVFSVQSLLER